MCKKGLLVFLIFSGVAFYITAGNCLAEEIQPVLDSRFKALMATIERGELEAAEAEVERIKLEFSAELFFPDVLFKIAEKYDLVAKRYEKAKSLYQEVIERFPTHRFAEEARLAVARLDALGLMLAEEYGPAGVAIDKMVSDFSVNPGLPAALYDLGTRYLWWGEYEEAVPVYQKIIQRYPESQAASRATLNVATLNILSAIKAGNDTGVEEAVEGLILGFYGHAGLPEAVLWVGEEYYKRALEEQKQGGDAEAAGDFAKAIPVWQKVTEEMPECLITAQVYYYSADCYRQLGLYSEAVECYEAVVESWPDFKYAWNALFLAGRSFEELAKAGVISKREAETKITAAYERLIANYPDCPAVKAAQGWLGR